MKKILLQEKSIRDGQGNLTRVKYYHSTVEPVEGWTVEDCFPDILDQLVDWREGAAEGWIYDEASGTFSPPPVRKPPLPPSPVGASLPKKINELEKNMELLLGLFNEHFRKGPSGAETI